MKVNPNKKKRSSPLHGEESVGHVVFLPLVPVKFFCKDIPHSALQQVWHLNISVSVKHSVQSLTDATEAVEGQSSHAQSEGTKKQVHLQTSESESKRLEQKIQIFYLFLLIRTI